MNAQGRKMMTTKRMMDETAIELRGKNRWVQFSRDVGKIERMTDRKK